MKDVAEFEHQPTECSAKHSDPQLLRSEKRPSCVTCGKVTLRTFFTLYHTLQSRAWYEVLLGHPVVVNNTGDKKNINILW